MIVLFKCLDFIMYVEKVLRFYEGRMHSVVDVDACTAYPHIDFPNELLNVSAAHSETRERRIDAVLFRFLTEWFRRLTWAEMLIVWQRKTVIGPQGPIMTQFTILGLLGWHLRLHLFHRGDGEGYHTHPRGFISVCLFGAYREHLLPNTWRTVRPGTVTIRGPADAHNVEPISFPCVTLAITTPVIASWRKFRPENEDGT